MCHTFYAASLLVLLILFLGRLAPAWIRHVWWAFNRVAADRARRYLPGVLSFRQVVTLMPEAYIYGWVYRGAGRWIHDTATIAEAAVVQANVVIGPYCTINADVDEGAIVHPYSFVAHGATIPRKAVVMPRTMVEPGEPLRDGCILSSTLRVINPADDVEAPAVP
jgi:acyl-[acyl carrier protein]--UDP-N-acetylglucosamine O-acyltransferase